MSKSSNDRNLLVAILALQTDLISQAQLIVAMQKWLLERSTRIEDILLRSQAIDSDAQTFLSDLAERYIQLYDDDIEKSLAALSSMESLSEFLRDMEDAGIDQTLAAVDALRLEPTKASDSIRPTPTDGSQAQKAAGERFRILRPHAKGALGKVSVAEDTELHREVALKEIQDKYADNLHSRSQFEVEAEVTGQLEHPGIVPVYSLGHTQNGRPFYVMRFIRGDSLREAIVALHSAQSPTNPITARNLQFRNLIRRLVDVCNAVEYAHSRGILHRDLKPGNIMLGKYGETLVVDWGLAKSVGKSGFHQESDEKTLRPEAASGSSQTRLGAVVGTVAYMSPEQAEGRLDELGPAADVYCLGSTLYHILTGIAPLRSASVHEAVAQARRGEFTPPSEVKNTIDPALDAICQKAMARNLEDRYATAMELAADLELWLADEPVPPYREPLLTRIGRYFRRHRTIAVTAAGVLIVSAIAAGLISAIVAAKNRDLAAANAQILQQNEGIRVALSKSEALRLIANAGLQKDSNPGLGLALAVAGSTGMPGREANSTLLALMDANHETATIDLSFGSANSIVFSRDGTLAVVTAINPRPRPQASAMVFSVGEGAAMYEFGGDSFVSSAVFSPDGRYVLTGEVPSEENAGIPKPESMTAVVRDARSGNVVATFPVAALSPVTEGNFDSGSEKVVLPRGNDAIIYRIRDKRILSTLEGNTHPVLHVEFSPDDKHVLTIADDSVRIWDPESGTEVGVPITLDAAESRQMKAAFTANAGRFVVREPDATRLYQVNTETGGEHIAIALRTENQINVSRSAELAVTWNAMLPAITVVSTIDFEAISQFSVSGDLAESHISLDPTGQLVAVSNATEAWVFEAETGNLVGELSGHSRTILDIAISADQRIGTVANDGSLRLWHAQSGRDRRTIEISEMETSGFFPQLNAVTDMQVGAVAVPSRRRAITTLRDAEGNTLPGVFDGTPTTPASTSALVTRIGTTVTIHETATSQELYRGKFSSNMVTAINPGGRTDRLVLISDDQDAFLVNTTTNARRRLLRLGETVTARAMTSDGSQIVLATSAGRIVSLNPFTGDENWTRFHTSPAASIAISEAGTRLVAVDGLGATISWQIAEETPVSGLVLSADDHANNVSFLKDDAFVVLWNTHGTHEVVCRNAMSGERIAGLEVPGKLRIRCHRSLPLVAVLSEARGVELWNPESGDLRTVTADRGTSADFLSDRLGVVTESADRAADAQGSFRIWRLNAEEPLSSEPILSADATVRADFDAQRFVLTENVHGADVFDFDTGEFLFHSGAHASSLEFMGLISGKRQLVTVSSDGTICLSDGTNRPPVRNRAPGVATTAVAMSRDGKTLLTGSSDGDVVLWSTANIARQLTLEKAEGAILSIRIDEEAEFAVITAESSSVRYWDLVNDTVSGFPIEDAIHAEISPDGNSLLVLSGTAGSPRLKASLIDVGRSTTVDLSQDGDTRWALFSPVKGEFALLSSDGRIDVLKDSGSETVCSFAPPKSEGAPVRFAFSHDGSLIAVDQGPQLSCWESSTGHELLSTDQLEGHRYLKALDFAWSPMTSDGAWLLTTDFGVRKSPLNPLSVAESEAPRELTDEERQRFRLDLTDIEEK